MITVGLSQHEINLISKVLDDHKVEYHVGAAGGAEDVKLSGKRGDTTFYQIEIHDGQYNALPQSAKSKLEGLGIYPEMDAPDFSEEYEPSAKKKLDPVKAKKTMRTFEIIFALAMVGMFAAFIMKVLKNQ